MQFCQIKSKKNDKKAEFWYKKEQPGSCSWYFILLIEAGIFRNHSLPLARQLSGVVLWLSIRA